jgi:hypothetical protein
MTMPRPQRKFEHGGATQAGRVWRSGMGLAGVLVALCGLLSSGLASNGPDLSTGSTVPGWIDANTGLAISGFDPVAYFTDGAALLGKGELEQKVGGVVWRFRSEGNRAAFMAHPEVYAPRFGGYDPVGVGRGIAVRGNPQLWLISQERLYLFYDNGSRQEFANDSERALSAANKAWPSAQLKIVQ